MNTPNPVPQPPVGYMPSNSTNASIIGGTVASLLMYFLSTKGVFLPAGAEAGVAALFGAVAGYLPTSGRK